MQIAIVLYPGLTALDAIGPYEVLRFIPDSEVRFVSHSPGPIMTDAGVLELGATHSYDETPSPDIVLVPGSEASTTVAMADARLLEWLNSVHETSRYTLSVCSGALVLAAAGILKGHPATTHWIAQDMLPAFGAEPERDKRIVQSGKIITAAGVSAGIDLALFVVGEVCGRERAEIVQLLIEYDPQPPFDSGHPSKASPAVLEAAREEMLARAVPVVSHESLYGRRSSDRPVWSADGSVTQNGSAEKPGWRPDIGWRGLLHLVIVAMSLYPSLALSPVYHYLAPFLLPLLWLGASVGGREMSVVYGLITATVVSATLGIALPGVMPCAHGAVPIIVALTGTLVVGVALVVISRRGCTWRAFRLYALFFVPMLIVASIGLLIYNPGDHGFSSRPCLSPTKTNPSQFEIQPSRLIL